jgi:hypothetical protein
MAVSLIGWVTRSSHRGQQIQSPEFDFARMSVGLLAQPSEPVTIPKDRRGDTAAWRVSLPTDNVVFYLIGSIEP